MRVRDSRQAGRLAGTRQDAALVDDVDPGVEHVPRAALRADVARFRRIGLQITPHPQDLRVVLLEAAVEPMTPETGMMYLRLSIRGRVVHWSLF